MPIDAVVAAGRLVETVRHLASAIPGGWARAKGAGLAMVAGVPVPTLSGVWAEKADADVERPLDFASAQT